MKAKKASKLLAMLLAVMMVVGMVPLTALAADAVVDYDTTDASTNNDTAPITVNFRVFETFGEFQDSPNLDSPITNPTPPQYNTWWTNTTAKLGGKSQPYFDGVTDFSDTISELNGKFTTANGWIKDVVDEPEYESGDTFYLAVNIDLSDDFTSKVKMSDNTSAALGVYSSDIRAIFDNSKFEVVMLGQTPALWANPMLSGEMVDTQYLTSGTPAGGSEVWNYISTTPLGTASYSTDVTFDAENAGGGPYAGKTYAEVKAPFGATATTYTYVPFNLTEWEFVVKMKVKAGAKGGPATIEHYAYAAGGTDAPMRVNKLANGGSTMPTGGEPYPADKYGSAPITIKILSTDPTATTTTTEMAAAEDREIKITLTNETFGTVTKDSFEFTAVDGATGTAPSVAADTDVTVADNKTSATIKVDASESTAGEKWKLAIKGDALDKTGDDATLEVGEIEILPALAGKITYTGTTTYGETITPNFEKDATITTAPTDIKWTWFIKGTTDAEIKDTNGDGEVTAADTGDTLTLGKQTGITYGDGGSTIYAKATSATFDGTSVGYDATNNVGFTPAKKALEVPTAISNIPGADVNTSATEDLKIEGTVYTFTEDDGILADSEDVVKIKFDTTYKKEDLATENNPTVTIKLADALESGDQSAYYEGTTNSVLNAEITTLTGVVSDSGYFIKNVNVVGGTVGSDAVTAKIETKITNAAGKQTLTITEIPAYYKVTKVELADDSTVDDELVVTNTAIGGNSTDGYTFEIEVKEATEDKLDVNFDITLAPNKKQLTVNDFDWKDTNGDDLSKVYDGTLDTEGTLTATAKTGTFYDGKTVTVSATAAYENKNVSDSAVIKITDIELVGDNSVFYEEIADGTVNGAITEAEMTGATVAVKYEPRKGQASVEGFVEAISGAQVVATAAGIEDGEEIGTVAELAKGDANLTELVTNELMEQGYKAVVPTDITDASAEEGGTAIDGTTTTLADNTNVKGGSALTFKLDTTKLNDEEPTWTVTVGGEVVDYTYKDGVMVITTPEKAADETAELLVKATISTGDVEFVKENITVATSEYEVDLSELENGDLVFDIADILDAGEIGNYSNVPDTVNATVAYKEKPTTSPSTGGYVNFVSDYGIPTATSLELDESGKIVGELPTVTDVVKGAVFVGWSTIEGSKAGLINPETFTSDKEEVTLYAIYDGYMMGNTKNEINATDPVTRAELIKMLVVASGMYDANVDYGDPGFTDTANHWAKNYIACAIKNTEDVVDGYTDGSFKPNAPVTRSEAAKFISGIIGVTVVEGAEVDALLDFATLQAWAKDYVAALYNTGAVDGRPSGNYDGLDNITREETAKIINTFIGLTAEEQEAIKADATIKTPFVDMVANSKWSYAHLVFASLNAPGSTYTTEITIPTRGE